MRSETLMAFLGDPGGGGRGGCRVYLEGVCSGREGGEVEFCWVLSSFFFSCFTIWAVEVTFCVDYVEQVLW